LGVGAVLVARSKAFIGVLTAMVAGMSGVDLLSPSLISFLMEMAALSLNNL
jgi:hypothetical protein